MDQSLMDRQLTLEARMRTAGVERFRKQTTEAQTREEESSTSYGAQLFRAAVAPLTKAIVAWIKTTKEAGSGRRATALKYLEQVEPEVAALVTAKVVIDRITRDATIQNTAMKVAGALEDEVRFTQFRETNKPLYETVVRELDGRTHHPQHRKGVLRRSMTKDGQEWDNWPLTDKAQLGVKLIELFVESTGLVEIAYRDISTKDTPIHIELTPATSKWIHEKCARSELMYPEYLPTLVPPKDWDSPIGGGYYSRAIRPLKLVKTRNWNYLEELKNRDLTTVYDAVNAMQRTAWKVHGRVLEVMLALVKERAQVAGIPAFDDEEMPPKPADIDTNREARTKWKHAANEAKMRNIRLRSKRLQFLKVLTLAGDFQGEEAIYFPYTLDFRGRIYAVPANLNPQGPDHAKALLTFAKGKPIADQTAADWLAIHGANLWGYDKVGMAGRVQWVKDNQAHILRSAEAPLDYRWWAEADGGGKAWQFLAFCFEWASYIRYGIGYVSSLPIALDGSCNGLQHFSAMLRDPIGGAAVNLTPSEQPQDIYQKVADVVIEGLKASPEEPLAQQWLAFGVDRKTTKRCVMILPYGGTEYGFRGYIQEHMHEKMSAGHPWPFAERDGWRAAVFLAKRIKQGIAKVVVAAVGAMDWLQKVAQMVGKEGLPINWTSPTGFPVLQAYYVERRIQVATQLFGRTRISLAEETDRIDVKRQQNGISPNFVHSLDAAALMYCVNAAHDFGVDSFAMVHDSYATVAADTEAMAICLRHAFLGVYATDVLKGFAEEVKEVLGEGKELPSLPPRGDLDLNQVLESRFFFA